jgi:dTDP-4-amino-4,6-dideoxygalactose transaminase
MKGPEVIRVDKPAFDGGEPIRDNFLPLAIPVIGQEEKDEVLDTLSSGWLSKGPKTHRFEQEFAQYIGCRQAIAVSSCTAALHVALAAYGIGQGDEVITSPMTFVSTANVIVHQHATPILVDCEPDTFNINTSLIANKITERTKAIIPIDMHGRPSDLDNIVSLAHQHGIRVIEDAAHAIGAESQERKLGAISDVTAFSFYATKNLTTGDGGMITTNDDDLANKMRVWSLHGMSADAWKRYSASGSAQTSWQAVYPGFKYNMTDIQAAIGLHQIRKLDNFIAIRDQLRAAYDAALADIAEITCPAPTANVKHAWHIYGIVLKTELLNISRDQFMQALRAENIGSGIHFVGVHLQPYYQQTFGYRPEDFPVASYLSERLISLPLFPTMNEQDIRDVAAAIKRIINHYRK